MPAERASTQPAPRVSWGAVSAATVVAVLGFVPIANWIPGGHAAPWYAKVAADWLNGAVLVVGAAVVLTILARRAPVLWRDGLLSPLARLVARRPVWIGVGLAFAAFALYGATAWIVFAGRPLLVDELVQLVQARIFASGALWRAAPAHPEFFSVLNLVDVGGRVYAQFPAGGPAMLAIGVIAGAPWLVGPASGAIAVAGFWGLCRRVEPRPLVALGAAVLFAFAPFAQFMSGSHMNHVPTLMWLVLAMLALTRATGGATGGAGRSVAWACASGLAFGAAATIRPVDALAFAAPAGVWYLWRALRLPAGWRELVAAGVGVSIPIAALLWVNASTTGAPLLFGYVVLWGREHGLGFHASPYGGAHTPAAGVQLINLYFLRLQTYLFETPAPSLVPVIGALALVRRLEAFDRYLLAAGAVLVGCYFAYWHDGFFLGPRFVYALLPALALWTARLPALVRERFGVGKAYRGTIYAYVVSAAMALVVLVPVRAREYGRGLLPMRWEIADELRRAGVRNGLVFVRESWGAQLVARLWALGVTRPRTELLYRSVDACRLEEGITALERSEVRGDGAFEALRPLLADSARVVRSPFSPDVSERALPGARYGATCAARLDDDRRGFGVLAPLLVREIDGNVFARDLRERDGLLAAEYPGRTTWLLRPRDASVGAPLEIVPLRLEATASVVRGPGPGAGR